MRKRTFFLSAVCFAAFAPAAWADDACTSQIPSALAEQVQRELPKYRLPLVTDNLAEDIEWNKKQGGSGCLGVALADFDGQNGKDLALGLTAREGSGAAVVAALAKQGGGWVLHVLDTWADGRIRLYVSAEKPGTHTQSEALDGSLEAGEESPMHCKNWGIAFGATESSGVVYCYTNAGWRHTWVSD